jgi:putative phosphotransacetylase
MFNKKRIIIPIEISARHCHLSKNDFEKLFGTQVSLTKIKQLTQPSDFACAETINVKSGQYALENVRIIGPFRNQTQVEISLTDAFKLKLIPPIRLSGDLKMSSAIKIAGPVGEIDLPEGLIIAKRHLHCSISEAKKLKFKSGGFVSVKINGERPVIFEDVIVRISDNYKLCLHIDTDEGNAAGINKIGQGFII